MIETDKIAISNLVKACQANQIKDVVISPGSRNAPLTISFTNNPYFNCYSIVDERSAAFFALGIAQQKKKPVALVCTSGSATLNYAPAVAEAYFQSVPLLVLTADRQKDGLKIGDGQVIDQPNIYINYSKASYTLYEQIEEKEDQNKELIRLGMSQLISEYSGPIHFNIPLAEPLYGKVANSRNEIESVQAKSLSSLSAKHEVDLLTKWNQFSKKLILVSNIPADHSVESLLIKLMEKDKSVIVLTETTANIFSKRFIPCIDRTIEKIPKEVSSEFIPDLIMTIGNSIISKKVKQLFRKFPPKEHWSVCNPRHEDVFLTKTEEIEDAITFITGLIEQINPNPNYNYTNLWKAMEKETEEAHLNYLATTNFSDLKAFEFLSSHLPACNLQMGNSSVVRYIQLFNQRKDIHYNSNRGVSGIEGCTSTALGAHQVTQNTILISGDISFFYDSNAFWNSHVDSTFKVIVINNGEGNIFKILPHPKEDKTSLPFFTTPHYTSIQKFCDLYDLKHFKVENEIELENSFVDFINNNSQASVLEIDTSKAENDTILKKYFTYLSHSE